MKLAPSHANCPSRTKPTKAQRCASQQNWLANDAVGHSRRLFAPDELAACPLYLRMAPEFVRCTKSLLPSHAKPRSSVMRVPERKLLAPCAAQNVSSMSRTSSLPGFTVVPS